MLTTSGHRSHGAEVSLVGDRAEDESERERAPDDDRGERDRVGFGQDAKAEAVFRLLFLRQALLGLLGGELAGYFLTRVRRVSRAALLWPISACELAMLSSASGAYYAMRDYKSAIAAQQKS